jgi:hypothetical protein
VNENVAWDASSATANYYATCELGSPQSSENNLYKMSFIVTVYQKGSVHPLSEIGVDGLALKITYQIKTVSGHVDDIEVTLARSLVVPRAKPSIRDVSALNKAVGIEITRPSSIEWSDGSSASPPTEAAAVIFKLEDGAETFDGYIPSQTDPDDDELTECTFDPALADGGSCLVCGTGSDSYLKVSQSALSSAGMPNIVRFSGSSRVIGGLDNGTPYVVAVMWSPDGIGISRCQTVTPIRDYTMSEKGGESEAESANVACFIASAAYGSSLAPHVVALRWFRDQVLLKFGAGRDFTRWYYEVSPTLAFHVRQSPALAASVRAALWVPVALIVFARDSFPAEWASLFLGGAAFAFLMIFFCALRVVSRRLSRG